MSTQNKQKYRKNHRKPKIAGRFCPHLAFFDIFDLFL